MEKVTISIEEALKRLRGEDSPDQLEGMARYGMAVKGRLGVSIPRLRRLAREIGKDHNLALELWRTEIAEARIIAAMIDDPTQ